jgi:hypothetical protein
MTKLSVPWPRWAILAFALPWLVTGCDTKPDDSNPTTTVTDAQTVQDQALLTFETIGGITDGIEQIAHGDFSELTTGLGLPTGTPLRAAEQIEWDPAQQAWVLQDAGTETDPSGTATYDIYIWIQFRDAQSVPQEIPDETTAEMSMVMDMTLDFESQENGEVFAFGIDYAVTMDVAGLPDGPYPITGSGTLGTTLVWTSPEIDDINVALSMSWGMDLIVPAGGGCPDGTMTVAVENYSVTANYDGTATYTWEMRENGVVIEAGSEPAACVVAAN